MKWVCCFINRLKLNGKMESVYPICVLELFLLLYLQNVLKRNILYQQMFNVKKVFYAYKRCLFRQLKKRILFIKEWVVLNNYYFFIQTTKKNHLQHVTSNLLYVWHLKWLLCLSLRMESTLNAWRQECKARQWPSININHKSTE